MTRNMRTCRANGGARFSWRPVTPRSLGADIAAAWGDFVLHRHVLDREDQGMMQNVRVAMPDGTAGAVKPHH